VQQVDDAVRLMQERIVLVEHDRRSSTMDERPDGCLYLCQRSFAQLIDFEQARTLPACCRQDNLVCRLREP